jgi:hypothetical protein
LVIKRLALLLEVFAIQPLEEALVLPLLQETKTLLLDTTLAI